MGAAIGLLRGLVGRVFFVLFLIVAVCFLYAKYVAHVDPAPLVTEHVGDFIEFVTLVIRAGVQLIVAIVRTLGTATRNT